MKGCEAFSALVLLALVSFGSCALNNEGPLNSTAGPLNSTVPANSTGMASKEGCHNILAAWGPHSNYTIWDAMVYRAGNLTNSMPFNLEAVERANNTGYSHYITLFAPDDVAMVSFLDAIKLNIHSYLTMDQQWLRTVLYTHAVPAVNLPFKVGDVYPTFNPGQNITVDAGRVPGEVKLSTDLTHGYINTTDARFTTCQTQWFKLEGVLLPPVNAQVQLNNEPTAVFSIAG